MNEKQQCPTCSGSGTNAHEFTPGTVVHGGDIHECYTCEGAGYVEQPATPAHLEAMATAVWNNYHAMTPDQQATCRYDMQLALNAYFTTSATAGNGTPADAQ